MKNKIIRGFVALFAVAAVIAADLKYTTLPQDNDSALVLANKLAVSASSNKSSNISTATTTVVKSGSGIIERILIGTAVAATTVVVYDNTAASGTKITTASTTAQGNLVLGCRFATGLTIVTDGTANITIIYR